MKVPVRATVMSCGTMEGRTRCVWLILATMTAPFPACDVVGARGAALSREGAAGDQAPGTSRPTKGETHVAVLDLERRGEPRRAVDVPEHLDHRLVLPEQDVLRGRDERARAVLDQVLAQVDQREVAELPSCGLRSFSIAGVAHQRRRLALPHRRDPERPPWPSFSFIRAPSIEREYRNTPWPHRRTTKLTTSS